MLQQHTKTSIGEVTGNTDLMNKTAEIIVEKSSCGERNNLIRQLLFFC
jgi:hypothetical protein